MSDVVYLECVACGARVSGMRTELGSIIVPGRDGCPRCGATDFSEVADGSDAADGEGAESSADVEVDPEAETRVRERE